jgi:hypothetical protein
VFPTWDTQSQKRKIFDECVLMRKRFKYSFRKKKFKYSFVTCKHDRLKKYLLSSILIINKFSFLDLLNNQYCISPLFFYKHCISLITSIFFEYKHHKSFKNSWRSKSTGVILLKYLSNFFTNSTVGLKVYII